MSAKKIRVHERALAHLTRGLYRSPASALRELVSNAWDANATRVSIDTNFPDFLQLSIEDNGDGFSKDAFAHMMGRGIGNSDKRVSEVRLRYQRPTIGRLGIGMLGIAQICGSFTIASRTRSGETFKARITLYDLAKSKMDERDSELVHDAETILDDETLEAKIVDVGTWDFEEFDADDLKHGTIIIADDVHPTFIKAFRESLTLEGYKPVPSEWKVAVTRVLSKQASLQVLGDYWRLLWELSASCPIPYISDDAIPGGLCRAQNEELRSYNFSLYVDGRELFKPVLLKGNKGGYTTTRIPETTHTIYGRRLTFSGYIVVQEGLQLKPDELRGVMVRIKNIGVGYYDPSMLDYRFNEGPRSRWLTAEIYVEEGLEDALNIDRDSFNRFHPEFRTLQTAVHELLRKETFPGVYKNIDKRSKQRKSEVSEKREKALHSVIRDAANERVRIKAHRMAAEDSRAPTYSAAARTESGIEVAVSKAEELPTSKSSQQLAHSVLTIFEVALLEHGREAQRRKFSDLLLDLLRHW